MEGEGKRPEKRMKVEHQFDGKFTLRAFDSAKDLDAASQAAFESFKAIATESSAPCEFPSVESVKDLIRYLSSSKDNAGVVAIDSAGKIIGSNFVELCDGVAAVGPLSVVASGQKHGIGKGLLEHVMNLVKARAAVKTTYACHSSSVDPSNSKLLSAYAFKRFQTITDMRGFVPSTVTIPAGYYVRVMTANDLYACDSLVQANAGHTRKNRLLNAKGSLPRFVVMANDENGERRLVGFTTGFHHTGFSVAENEDALKSLIITYSQSLEYITKSKKEESSDDAAADADKGDPPSVCVQVLTELYPNLGKWLTEQGFKSHSQRTVSLSGKQQTLKSIYVPSYLF